MFQSILSSQQPAQPSAPQGVSDISPSFFSSSSSSAQSKIPLRLQSNTALLRSQSRTVVTSLPDDQSNRRSVTKRMCYASKSDPPEDEVEEEEPQPSRGFVSARNQYIVDQQKKFGKSYNPNSDQYI